MRPQFLFVSLVLVACSEAPAPDPQAVDSAARSAKPAARLPDPPPPFPRVHTAELESLRRALDLGPLSKAREQIVHCESAGEEALLLRARLAAMEGKSIEALRLIESARAQAPRSAAVFATAAEVYAASEGFDSAAREIVRGEKECGPSAEFLRARGVLSILRPGGAQRGLAELEAARKADPSMPFLLRPLGQAHLLVAKEAAKEQDLARAYQHAQWSLSFDPEDVDARRFLSECMSARGEFAGALEILRRLIDEGEALQPELALLEKRAGIAALLVRQKDQALEHFRSARRLGLSDAELASGARLLAESAQAHTERGVEHYRRQELEAAELAFRAALNDDPASIAAQNHLAVVLFARQQYSEAARYWQQVLEIAQAEELELPEPVELNLAKALRASGELEAARRTLESFLAARPQSPHAALAQRMLESL